MAYNRDPNVHKRAQIASSLFSDGTRVAIQEEPSRHL
jgi:hypothetical protein